MPAEMINASLEAWLTAPLDEIGRRFSAGLAAGLSAAAAEQQAAAALTEFASQPDIWRQLPLLNATPSHAWRAGRLARFRGMVQDMHDPEFYLRAFGVRGAGATRTACGRYRDVVDCGPDEALDPDVQETGDRQTLRCVTVPRRTPWSREEDRPAAPPTETGSGERESSAAKRTHEDEEEDCEMQEETTAEDGEKKVRTTNGSANSTAPATGGENSSEQSAASVAAAAVARDLPIPGSDAMVCLVKVYSDEHELALNDLVEFVGVVTLDPTLAAAPEVEDAMEADEAAAHHPPPSLAPRLHAVTWRRLEHSNPLLPDVLPAPPAEAAEEMSATRRQLLTVLQTALLGDALAAELVLCHLLSSVYIRHDVMALGKLALNVSNLTPAATAAGLPRRLYSLLERLTEKALLVPLSIAHLNSATLVPSKDYKRNVLVTGDLQLSRNTHLVLDETELSQGQLDERGVKNLSALGHLITWQKVEYDFSFHRLAYEADVPVLVLSEGRSLLPSDCRVPLQPAEEAERLPEQHRALEEYLTPSLLQQIRRYLTVCRRLPYAVPEALQAAVQQEFVSWRQESGNQVKAEDLHHLLVLARLLSLSHGKTELTEEVWREARRIEEQRRARVERAGPTPVAA
ncbi:mini-chromosome maintenance complex-binding protein-like [Amphibalanus amphitrite]|uniref:mini-chromosome maintenance complex-binding protein-like n=1 Tax=Amphibalanus amphitrite TaxID=1232801 RepID=UPI001C92B3B2|nr:mini-chromosome maintenance complex-binding protein-like [Amphibalanus amphitrite]